MYQNLFKPTYLKELCQKYNLSPSKKYGQNYLVSEGVIDKIINIAELKKTDTVIEIGPGFGVLTFALAEKAGKVISFEIERKLEDYWKDNKKDNLEIVWGNALRELTTYSLQLTAGYKVVANIPYQITSNILRVLLEAENKPKSITVMVQKEVAERICAKIGEMSLLAVSVQYYGEPKIISKVSKGNFWPSPKVDSAILYIKTKASQSMGVINDERFFDIVRAGFKNKRKQLWRNLAIGLDLEKDFVKKVLQEISGNEKIRAQDLSIDHWRQLTTKLK